MHCICHSTCWAQWRRIPGVNTNGPAVPSHSLANSAHVHIHMRQTPGMFVIKHHTGHSPNPEVCAAIAWNGLSSGLPGGLV